MRKTAALVAGLALLIATVGCAPSQTERHSYQQVKCPACGYSFNPPQH